jgi:hypothetical protein
MRTSATAVFHVFDAPPVVVALWVKSASLDVCSERTIKSRTYGTVVRRTPRVRKHLEERRRPVCCPGIRNLAHVNVHRAPMSTPNSRRLESGKSASSVTSLLVHFDGDGVSRFDGATACYSTAVDVAAEVVGGDVGHGVVGGGHANAGLALVDAIDPEVLECGVGGDLGCR